MCGTRLLRVVIKYRPQIDLTIPPAACAKRGRTRPGMRRLACDGRRGPESHLMGLQPTYS